MKAYIYDWCCCAKHQHLLKQAGFQDHQEIEVDKVFGVAKQIFDVGLNVMIIHPQDEDGSIILGVDTKKFQQR